MGTAALIDVHVGGTLILVASTQATSGTPFPVHAGTRPAVVPIGTLSAVVDTEALTATFGFTGDGTLPTLITETISQAPATIGIDPPGFDPPVIYPNALLALRAEFTGGMLVPPGPIPIDPVTLSSMSFPLISGYDPSLTIEIRDALYGNILDSLQIGLGRELNPFLTGEITCLQLPTPSCRLLTAGFQSDGINETNPMGLHALDGSVVVPIQTVATVALLPLPEPSTVTLIFLGLMGLELRRRSST